MVLALVHNKGGVGKTTTAVNLAAVIGGRGRRTLLVDLDSQSCASLSVGLTRRQLSPSAADALLYGLPVERVIRRGQLPGVDLIPGSIELANADLVLADVPGRERCLRALLDTLRPRYDLVIIDCPPGFSLLTVNALAAADAFIVPVSAQYLPIESLGSFIEAVGRLRHRLGIEPRLLGILLTMVDRRAKPPLELADAVRASFKTDVFHTEIPVNQRLADAPGRGEPAVSLWPESAGADAYRRLAGEVLERLSRLRPAS